MISHVNAISYPNWSLCKLASLWFSDLSSSISQHAFLITTLDLPILWATYCQDPKKSCFWAPYSWCLRAEQRSADDSQRVKSGLLSVFVAHEFLNGWGKTNNEKYFVTCKQYMKFKFVSINKVSVELGHAHLFTYCLWLSVITAELSHCNKNFMVYKACNIYNLSLTEKGCQPLV